jgi:hypothetical protein
MKNGRENRNNGNQEKGKKEKETLSSQYEVNRGRAMRPLSFLGKGFEVFKSSGGRRVEGGLKILKCTSAA